MTGPANPSSIGTKTAAPILVLNAGSTSLKAGLFTKESGANFAAERALLTVDVSGIGQPGSKLHVRDAEGRDLDKDTHSFSSEEDALAVLAEVFKKHLPDAPPVAIGHRVVHGGPHLLEHAFIDESTIGALEKAVHFAPLHLPQTIRLIREAERVFPKLPQFACFDTAFHRTMPAAASTYPLPLAFAAAGLRRYGFHGLSYDSIVRQLRAKDPVLPRRIVAAHLGGGSSLCAIYEGTSLDTTMGLTPTGGVPMATRTGDLDPGVLLFLARQQNLSADGLEQLVNHGGGLAAISGTSGDMQELEAVSKNLADPKQKATSLALAIYTEAVAKAVAALTVSLGGIDLLVFSGGIGEHSAFVRGRVLEALSPFGIVLAPQANHDGGPLLTSAQSRIEARIVTAQEDLLIALETRALLSKLEDRSLASKV